MKGSKRRGIMVVVLALAAVVGFASKPSTRTIAKAAPNLTNPARLDTASQARLVDAYGKLPLSFEANQGQTDRRVKFLSRGSGYTLLLTGDEAVLALRSRQSPVVSGQSQKTTDHGLRTTDTLRMKLVGAHRSPRMTGLDELPG